MSLHNTPDRSRPHSVDGTTESFLLMKPAPWVGAKIAMLYEGRTPREVDVILFTDRYPGHDLVSIGLGSAGLPPLKTTEYAWVRDKDVIGQVARLVEVKQLRGICER